MTLILDICVGETAEPWERLELARDIAWAPVTMDMGALGAAVHA